MADAPIQIKRYPNRRYYARNTSKYVSLEEIEEMIKSGENVEIRDSQTGDELTRSVLAQIIIERQPEKMALFPTDMLHFILRANDVMSDFLRDYFRHSLTYLSYLQQHSRAAKSFTKPMHWVKAWLDGIGPNPEEAPESPPAESDDSADNAEQMAQRLKELEERLKQLETRGPDRTPTAGDESTG